jgi:multiple sugar transport system substrate-binding protein
MKRVMIVMLSFLLLVVAVEAQAQEIRVLLANHPYGETAQAAIPEFEKTAGIKVNVESLQESQLTTKLTTEFATNLHQWMCS